MDKEKTYLLAEFTIYPNSWMTWKRCSNKLSFLDFKSPVVKHRLRPHERAPRISWSALRSSPLRRHIGFTLSRTTRSGCLRHWRASCLQCRSWPNWMRS